MRHRYFGAASAAVCLVVLSTSVLVSGAASASTKPDIPAPAGLPSFYSVPQPLPKGPVGTLIKSETVSDSNLVGATMHIVMYKSKGPKGAVPVTGMVAIPNGTPPAGGWPVVTWGHRVGSDPPAATAGPVIVPSSTPPASGESPAGGDGCRSSAGPPAGRGARRLPAFSWEWMVEIRASPGTWAV